MRKEDLRRANEIQEELKLLYEQKANIENLNKNQKVYENIQFSAVDSILSKFIDIEILTTLSLKKVESEIAKLELEFDKL